MSKFLIWGIVLGVLIIILFYPIKISLLVSFQNAIFKIEVFWRYFPKLKKAVFRLDSSEEKTDEKSTKKTKKSLKKKQKDDKLEKEQDKKEQDKKEKFNLKPQILRKIIYIALKHLKIEKFKLNINMGVDDPPKTAVLTGALWSIFGVIIGWLSQKCKKFPKKPELGIYPYWYGYAFAINGVLSVGVNLASLLIAAIKIFFIILKEYLKKKISKKKIARKQMI